MTDDRPGARFLTFNGIGLLGLAVQVALLAALTRLAHVHYLAATAIAVEAALLHNFVWHQRWTWRDRPVHSRRAAAARLLRFHLLNGTVSLAGNLAVMSILTGRAGLDPVAANLIAVAACSVVNFAGSQHFVFASRQTAASVVTIALVVSIVPLRAAGDRALPHVQAPTLAAWQAYERLVDRRYSQGVSGAFFVEDAFTGSSGWRRAAESGATPTLQLPSALPNGHEPDVPGGRIHHWAGAVFVPGTSVEAVVRSLEAHAGQESQSYDDVIASRLLARDGDRVRVFMKLRRTKVITATYNTEHEVEYRRLDGRHASSRSRATGIAELADAGTPAEREKGPDDDSGYLWRLNAYWRFEETPSGVLIECESLSLSRGIPMLLRPLVSGVVEGVARDSLLKTLASLRLALTAS